MAPAAGEQDPARGVFGITTAAELVGNGVQNLRLYEKRGLLTPDRTDGGTRRYSAEDLTRLRRIGELLESGLNLAGIAVVLDLEADNAELRRTLQQAASAGRETRPQRRNIAQTSTVPQQGAVTSAARAGANAVCS